MILHEACIVCGQEPHLRRGGFQDSDIHKRNGEEARALRFHQFLVSAQNDLIERKKKKNETKRTSFLQRKGEKEEDDRTWALVVA